TIGLILSLGIGEACHADLIVTSVPHLIMQEGSIQEGDFTVLNNASFPVEIDFAGVRVVFLLGDPTDIPSVLAQQTGFPVIPPGESFIFKYNVFSSFDDSPFEPVDSGFSALIFDVAGFEVGNISNGFSAQGIGDVLVLDIA